MKHNFFSEKFIYTLSNEYVLELDEDTLAEHLLFINNVTLTYEKDTFLVTTVC